MCHTTTCTHSTKTFFDLQKFLSVIYQAEQLLGNVIMFLLDINPRTQQLESTCFTLPEMGLPNPSLCP